MSSDQNVISSKDLSFNLTSIDPSIMLQYTLSVNLSNSQNLNSSGNKVADSVSLPVDNFLVTLTLSLVTKLCKKS